MNLALGKYLSLIGLAAVLFLVGCSRNEAQTEEERRADPPASSSRPGAELKFSAPPGWIPETPSSRMRQAQYSLPRAEGDPEDAEVAVFFFPGQGGSVRANIDRWIGQFSQEDGSPATEVAEVTRRESSGIPLTVVDISGTYRGSGGPMMAPAEPKPNFRMLSAVAETANGPWFFKLTGPAETVAKWEASFHSFLDTLQ